MPEREATPTMPPRSSVRWLSTPKTGAISRAIVIRRQLTKAAKDPLASTRSRRVTDAVRLAAIPLGVFLMGCGGASAHLAPSPGASGTTLLPVVPEAADLARAFHAILGATNAATYAVAGRVRSGVEATGASLPPDLVALATAAGDQWTTAARQLATHPWPQPLQVSIDAVVSSVRTFAADLNVLSGLSPSLFLAWQGQFARDGARLNGAIDAVHALLGLPPVPPA